MTTATVTAQRGAGRRWREYAAAAGVVLLTTAVCLPLRARLTTTDVAMLYLLAVVVVATWSRRGPALLASALGIACFDLGFVAPYGEFDVRDPAYLLTFAVMLAVAVVMSGLTARIRAQAEAAAVREQHMAAERLRSTLLSSLSHDLRTPLAGIEGAATALLDDAETSDARELAGTIVEESRRMARLVGNLLDMVRLETGTLAVQKSWLPVEELVGVALLRLEERLAEHPVEVALPTELPLVPVDEVLMEQVLVNLLENAAKHTPPGTPIVVRAWTEGAAAVLEVADRGPGIPAGEAEAVFRKFYRTTTGGRPAAGAGLGLAICRGFVTAHGGRIWVEARPDGGAAFRVAIPLDAPPPSLPPAADAE